MLFLESFRILGRPLSIILDDSEPPLRWHTYLPVLLPSSLPALDPSHGRGEERCESIPGAEMGVWRLDIGVASGAERGMNCSGVEAPVTGVYRPWLEDDSSNRPDFRVSEGGVLPERSCVAECLDCKRGAGEEDAGMTSGARRFGDGGCGPELQSSKASSIALERSSVVSRFACTTWSMPPVSADGSSGALIERSWSGGRPGIVATILSGGRYITGENETNVSPWIFLGQLSLGQAQGR